MTQVSTRCQHHWIIETPTGPISRGICQICGEEREFENSPETGTWAELRDRHRRDQAAELKEEQEKPAMIPPRRNRRPERGAKPNMQGVERDAQWLERNRDVLGLLLQGVSVLEIAHRLGKSTSTIGKIRVRLRDLGELETGA
ncbi:MAG: hypothetical protein ACE5Q6_06980 [Dehalococcoidia bacterium]